MSGDQAETFPCAGLTITGKACANFTTDTETCLCMVCKQKDNNWIPQQPINYGYVKGIKKDDPKKEICSIPNCNHSVIQDSTYCEIHSNLTISNITTLAADRCIAYLPTGHRCPEKPIAGGCCKNHQQVAQAIVKGEKIVSPAVILPAYDLEENIKRLSDSLAMCHNIAMFGNDDKDRINAARTCGYLVNIIANYQQISNPIQEALFIEIITQDQIESGNIIDANVVKSLNDH